MNTESVRRAQLSIEFLALLSLVILVFVSMTLLLFSFQGSRSGLVSDIAEAEGAALVLESASSFGMPFEYTNFSWKLSRVEDGKLVSGKAKVPVAFLPDFVMSSGYYPTYNRFHQSGLGGG